MIDVVDEEFEDFLNFFTPPSNLNAILTLENVTYVLKLADKFLCDDIILKCRSFLLGSLNSSKTPMENTKLLNLANRYFKTDVGEI